MRVARDQADIKQKHQQCLESFVVRARPVAEHSLADGWENLVALIDPKIGIRFENGERGAQRHRPG
ncbi:hypothetical protein [Streptomyces sp. NPDC002467]|uniref:hypothetical protein n=1 Tax=Streptomyces sp. NPDC002467 TaxID=3364647 RepID=UPI003691A25E